MRHLRSLPREARTKIFPAKTYAQQYSWLSVFYEVCARANDRFGILDECAHLVAAEGRIPGSNPSKSELDVPRCTLYV